MEASLDGCKNVPGDQKALEAHLKRLQELQKQKGAGQALLNAVVDNGESMYLSLSVESRDQVRKETRGLRDAWDSAWDKHTCPGEGTRVLSHGLDCGRVASWLADLNTLIGSDVELKPNLSEKQLQLQNIRALSQDVMSHQAVVSKLQTKSQELKETSMAGQVDGLVSDYEALCTRTKANIAQCEKRVSEHEAYQHSLERFLDWVSTLKATVDGPEEQGDMEAVKAKMAAYALVLESEPEACAKLEHLRDALESRVLPGTCPSGHEALQEQYAAARAQWEALLDACEEGHSHAKETLDRWDEATKTLDELEQWLASQRARCQDIPLQATAEAKRQQLDTLKKVEQDVVAKEGDFSVLSKNAQAAPTDTMLTPQLDKLRSKYHLLRNTIKLSLQQRPVAKWEKLAKQHEAFDKLLAELEEWLKQPEKELDEIVDAKADLASTQDQKNKLENLSDRLAQRSSSMDELVESGERLYSHTAPDGRETIRQQLRHVKGRWQTLVERSTEALAELDQRLQQLSGLSQSQDQLRQWIEDVKTALDSCSQPRATLQEKKAQLQTHKVVHQDILSHQPAIDSMCERAQNLSATAAGKDTLGDHVQSTKAAFQELCTRSQGLTGQLTSAVEDHQKLVDKVVAFQDWIQSFQDQLQEHKDTTGEKKAIQGRLEQLTELTEKSKEGEVLLTEVREQSQVVSARSSPQGQALLSRELQGLQELLGKTLTSLQEARRNLENTLQQWGAYESHLASLTQWLSDTEAELRAPQMPATLADKEALSARGKELRNKIAEKQKSVDSFIDEAHCLLQLSGVELVRAQMSQCNARYQSLVATIKDLAARWEGMEKDQREYEKAVASCNAWLDEAEQTLSQIQTDKAAPEEKLTRLETLIVGKVHGQQQLNLASRLGEHLYQDTAATGRDQVRLELRELHERWESLESKIADLQKQLQLQSHARSSFVDSLSQVQMWLDNAERTVAEARDKLPSLQEAQGRLHSLKLLQQEAVLQRRQLDSLEETSRGDVSSKESLETTSTRLGIVTEELKTLLAGLERLSALAQEQRERKEQLAAWLEQMHERLDLCRDVTGSRPVLKTRLDKLQELEKQQPEGTCKAQALAECTATLVTLLTPRERAALEQESGTLEGSGAEQTVQQFALQATLDEKRQQLDKFQSLLSELHATERDFDSLSDKAQELMVSSGEMRLSMAVSQLTARFQSLLETCKELVKKCEQHAQETFVEIQALPSGNKERLSHKLARVKELLQGKSEALNLVNATVQLAEQVQVGSSPEGWKAIQGLLQQLQSAYEAVFDKAQNLERVLQSSQFLWSEYHEALQRLQAWLKGLTAKAEGASRLCTTLDEKKAHLRTCRGLLAELNEREQAIEDIQIKAEAIADRDNESQEMLEGVVKGHKEQTQKLQEAVKFLEDAVTQHEQLSKHLGNVRDWLSSTQEQAVALSNLGLDQLALYSNLERLKAIEASFSTQDEEMKRAEKQLPVVLQSTLPAGHNVVVGELDALKQQWQVVSDMVTRARESLEQLLSRWEDHHVQVEKLQQWMSEKDAELQGLLLCDTLEAKRSRLEKLQETLRELRSKELEVDSLTERAQQLHGGHSTRRSSRLADLALRYQQLLVALTEAVTKWTQYVNNHQTLDKQVADAQQQIKQANEKLDQCELADGSLSQLESKLAIIQEVSHNKDALVSLVQAATEQCQTVLGETAPRLSALRATLDHARQLWGGLSTLTKQVLSAVEGIEASLEDAGKLQETLAEKKAHAERSKVLEQRLLQEQAQVDNLKSRATELAKSHPGNEHSEPAFEAVERFKDACKRAEKLVETTEKAYRSHLDFKNACDDLVSWLRQLREKVPPFTRSLSDRLSLESSISVLEDLLAKRAEGNLKLDAVVAAAETTKASTSEPGIALLDNQVSALKGDLTSLFDEISTTKDKLGTTCAQLREFREEYEHMSEWLQLMEDDIKNQRTLLWPTLEEKKKAFETAQVVWWKSLRKGHETLDRVTLLAQGLLTSHLDTYIRNQLTLVSSRYQVTLNLAKDLLGRARDVYNQHEQYRTAVKAAREWMDTMAASLAECSGPTTGKSDVEAQLAKVQGMVRKQDEGHALVHAAMTAGEKTLRGTHTSGKAPLNQEMQELQKQWDRLVLKLSDAKPSSSGPDYSSSEQRLLQWIADHDNQLEEVKKKRQSTSVKESVTQRKARLRRANSLVKDVESFEPMVESLAVKAQELQQTSAAPKPEISGKYNNLAGSVKEFLRQQKSVMGHLQEFMDACANLSSWLEQAQEKLNKCAEPSGDRNELRSKHGTLKVLEAEQEEGQKRLQLMLALAETARGFMEDEVEQQHVDQEAGQLVKAVAEFEERMAQVKTALDVGLVKWDEYEEQFRRCQDWLNQHEPQVRSFQQLQPDLESKRVKLEEFQVLLQTVFEWQSEFDTLNLKAQLLLETYSDSSICNQFTQLSARYTSLLSLAKGGAACTRATLPGAPAATVHKPSATLDDAESRLRSLDLLWATLQQGRNKVSYMMELTDKVIETTSAEGVKTIRESADNTSAEYERLLQEVSAVRSALSEQLSALGELAQELQQFESWLAEARAQLAEAKSGAEQASGAVEKKTRLDKIKSIAADAASKSGTAASLEKRLKETKQLDTPERKKMIADFSELQKEAEELAARLEKEVEALERQRSVHAQAVQWLKEAKLKLQKCSDATGSQAVVREKATQLSKLRESLPTGVALVKDVAQCTEEVSPCLNQSGKERLQENLQELRQDLEQLEHGVEDAQDALDECLQCWERFGELYGTMSQWLSQFEGNARPALASTAVDADHLKQLKALLEEASFHKPDMEEMNEECERLLLLSAQTPVRDQAVKLSTLYTSLVAALQPHRKSSTLPKNPGKDLATVQKHLAELKELHQSLSEGKHLFDVVTEAASKTQGGLSDVSQAPIRSQVDSLRDQLTTLEQLTSEATGRMASLQSRWQELMQGADTLKVSLREVEESLKERPVSGGDLVQIRCLVEQYKHTARNLDDHKQKLKELRLEASELAEKTDGGEVLPVLREMADQLDSLQKKCQATLDSLESELHDAQSYHKALQEAEKWLLQMSFPVMAQHSLQVLNKQQTQEQIDKYKGILAEVKQYQSTLDDVKAKGRGLVNRYKKDAPQLEQQVQSQLDNIQESYDALLTGANQVLARLESALQKFISYETMLEVCDKLLEELEPKISALSEDTPKTAEASKIKLETCKGMLTQLTEARTQFQEAIQGCIEAVSSVSRPSSPEVATVFSVPEQEASIKIRLQDNIEQLEAIAAQLEVQLRGFEEAGRKRAAIEDWIVEKQSTVTQMGSAKFPPQTLALQAQLRQLEDIKHEVSEKLTAVDALELKSGTPGASEAALRDRLHQLEAQVSQVAGARATQLETLEEYNTLAGQVDVRLNAVESSLDSTQRPTVGDAKQRLQTLNVLLDEVNSIGGDVADLRGKIAVLTKCLEPDDKAKCDDQLKCLEGKCDELRKRILRRTKSLDLIQNGLDALYSEAATTEKWLLEKQASLEQLPNPGYQSSSVEAALQAMKAEQRQVENKRAVVQDFEKRIESFSHELDSLDAQQLEQMMQDLKTRFADLLNLLASHTGSLTELLNKTCRLDDELEIVRQWLREKEQDLRRVGAPAQDADDARNLLSSVQAMQKEDASPEDCAALQKLVQEPVDKVKELQQSLAERLKQLKELVQLYDEYQKALSAVKSVLSEREASLAADLLLTTSEDVIREQLDTHRRLQESGSRLSADLSKMQKLASKLGPAAGANREIRVLTETKDRLDKLLSDRITSLEDALAELQQQRTTLNQCSEELDDLCRRLESLGGPLGPAVQDAEVLLSALQKVQTELKDLQSRLERMQGPGPLSEAIGRLLERCEVTLQKTQGQLGRAKQALSLRQQYHQLREQVAQAIARLTDTVAVLEKAKKPAAEKLPQYDNLLAQVADAEGQLTSAQDKGEALAEEGSSADHNAILGDLGNLKSQLASLRNPESIDAELESHKELQRQSEEHLEEARKLEEQLFKELPSELLASRAQEELSELALLRSTLPQQLQERGHYLGCAQALRRDYWAQRDALVDWLDRAERVVAAARDGVDLDGLDARCKELRDVCSETAGYSECLRSLQALLTQIRPTMDPEASQLPEQELATLQQRLTALTSGSSASSSKHFLATLEPSEEKPASIRALRKALQSLGRLQEEAQRSQPLLAQLSEAARVLERKSGPASRDLPGNQAKTLSKRWQEAMDDIQARKERMAKALADWEAYSQALARARTTLEAREHDLAAIQPLLLDVTAAENALESLLSQVTGEPLGVQVEEAGRKAEPVLSYLDWASQPAATGLRNELQALRDRHSQLQKSIEQHLQGVREERAAQAAFEEKVASLREGLLEMERDIGAAPHLRGR
ncbi:hypothetical protein MTO96_015704 [Rhipicephalus appendiculatus]